MTPLNTKHLLERIDDSRCIKSANILTDEDYLICSKTQLPGLYCGSMGEDERKYLHKVIQAFEPSDLWSNQMFSTKSNDRLRSFYLQLLDLFSDRESLEAVLHQFLYRFWTQVDSSEAFGFPKQAQLHYKCQVTGNDPIGGLLGRLRRNGCQCDLAAYSETDRVLWLIDVKREAPDDRAVGQIQRYYQLATAALEDEDPQKNIRCIRPALICPKVDVSPFFSMGIPFRDICEIWTYEIKGSLLRVKDERLKLLSQIRHKRHLVR